jgi:hypothetical protein
MAHPQEKREQSPSAVASCSATDCQHNEDQECHAGEIKVEIGSQGAICGTYSPTRPKTRP